MHSDTPGVLVSLRGHTFTVDEGHAAVCGLIGLILGASESVSRAILEEFPYFLVSLLLSFAAGRWLRRAGDAA